MPTSQPGDPDPQHLAEELRMSIARLSRRLRGQGSHLLTITQFAALAALERHCEMTPRELADHEKVRPPSMTRVIASLEAERLVERSPHPTDRRQVRVRLTARGRDLLREERALKEAWLSQRLAELTPRERETLTRAAPILDKLSKA